MAVTQHSEFSSMTAAADYSAKQYHLVTQTGDQQVTLAGDGVKVFGVINNKPKSGETAEVVRITAGVTFKVKLEGTVDRGDRLASNANAKAIEAVAGDESFGYAMEGGVSGDVIECYGDPLLIPTP